MADTDYLEEERKKLWDAIENIRIQVSQIEIRTPEDVQAIKQDRNKTSEYRNRCQERNQESEELLTSLQQKASLIKQLHMEFLQIHQPFLEDLKQSKSSFEKFSVIITKVEKDYETYPEKIALLEAKLSDIQEKIDAADELISESQDRHSSILSIEKKVISLHAKTEEIHAEAQQLYEDLFGKITEQGAEVEGKKQKLEKVYKNLEVKFQKMDSTITDYKTAKNNDLEQFKLERLQEHKELTEKIEALLPNALTAGLSHAYAKKREVEEKERQSSEEIFQRSITFMTILAIIPIAVSIYLIYGLNIPIKTVILDLPRLTLAFLPIYIPTLWIAKSSSRKANLSKRLIEEYTHKEVVSKTFESLSNQIEKHQEGIASEELKERLLYNIVMLNTENPGKLIKEYNADDHPILDVIDRSVALTNSLERLKNLPGLKTIAQHFLTDIEAKDKHRTDNVEKVLQSKKEDEDE